MLAVVFCTLLAQSMEDHCCRLRQTTALVSWPTQNGCRTLCTERCVDESRKLTSLPQYGENNRHHRHVQYLCRATEATDLPASVSNNPIWQQIFKTQHCGCWGLGSSVQMPCVLQAVAGVDSNLGPALSEHSASGCMSMTSPGVNRTLQRD